MAGLANLQDVFLIFGDSITEVSFDPEHRGFGQRLAHVYARKLDVVNRGLSGYNTERGLRVLKQCITTKRTKDTPKIRIITIWFGANDACIPSSPQNVPISTFTSNLEQMISLIRAAQSESGTETTTATRIVLLTPPPVNTYQRSAALASRNPPQACDRDFSITKRYAEAVISVAKAEGVPFVDVWTAMYEAAERHERKLEKFLHDGLHLNEAGYHLVYEHLMETILECHPDVYYENIPYTLPRWDELI